MVFNNSNQHCCEGPPLAVVFARTADEAHEKAWEEAKRQHAERIAKLPEFFARWKQQTGYVVSKREQQQRLNEPPPPRDSMYATPADPGQIIF